MESITIKELDGVTPEYQNLLDKANRLDFSTIANSNCLIPVGTDQQGVPIFLINAVNLPTMDKMEEFLIYFIKTLEPVVVSNNYSLIYSHALIKQESTPDRNWLTNVYKMLPRNFKKNLKTLYILHPSTWIKFLFMAMSPFLSEKVWNKVSYLDYIQEIPGILDRNAILSKIPQSVKDYDNGLLENPEITEKVVTSMDTLGKELLSVFGSSFNLFSSVDPTKWQSAMNGSNERSAYYKSNYNDDDD